MDLLPWQPAQLSSHGQQGLSESVTRHCGGELLEMVTEKGLPCQAAAV